jgi:putative endonuclease
MNSAIPHCVYIIRSDLDGTYYVGSTQNLEERLERHNQGRSQYTKAKRPWRLVYSEEHPDRSSAVKRENEIKWRKSRKFVDKLVERSRHL